MGNTIHRDYAFALITQPPVMRYGSHRGEESRSTEEEAFLRKRMVV